MKHSIRIALIGAAGMTIVPLTGCNQVVDNGQIINVWATFNDTYGGMVKKFARQFHKEYPEYIVRYTKQSGSYNDLKDKVIKGVAGGTYPDMFVAYPDSVAELMSVSSKCLDISKYMSDEEIGWTAADYDDIPAVYIEEGQNYAVPGTYSLPMCKSSEALYYNRDKLIGLDLTGIDNYINNNRPLDDAYFSTLTWEELFEVLCPAIAEYDANHPDEKIIDYPGDYTNTGAIVGYDSDDNFFITLAEQYGLQYTSVNEVTGKGSVDYVEKSGGSAVGAAEGYMELMKKINLATQNHTFGGKSYKYLTTSKIMGKRTNYCFTGKSGGMLFSIGSTGGAGYQYPNGQFDVGVTYLPQPEGFSERKVINQGPSVAFLKRGKNADIEDKHARGAWLFYKYWSNAANNASWAITTGYAPIRDSVFSQTSYINYSKIEDKKEKSQAILDARNAQFVANNTENLFSSPVFPGSSKARSSVEPIFYDIWKDYVMPQWDDDNPDPDYDAKVAAFEAGVNSVFVKAFKNAV